jgi:hypothetical protein
MRAYLISGFDADARNDPEENKRDRKEREEKEKQIKTRLCSTK